LDEVEAISLDLRRQVGANSKNTAAAEDAEARLLNLRADAEKDRDAPGAADLTLDLGVLASQRDRLDEAESRLRDALSRYRAIDDGLGEAHAIFELGRLAMRRNRVEDAEALLRDALARCRALRHELGVADVTLELGTLAVSRSRLDEADTLLRDAQAQYEGIEDQLGAANATRELGTLALRRDRLDEGEARFRDALARYEAIDHALGTANTSLEIGVLARHCDRLDEAEVMIRDALARYEAIDEPLGAALATRELGTLALSRDRHDEAETLLRDALARSTRIEDMLGAANAIGELGTVVLACGRLEEAEVLLRDALARSSAVDDGLGIANPTYELGKLARLRGRYDEASSLLRDSLAQYETLASDLGAANAIHELGRLELRLGHDRPAIRLLGEAATRYGAIDSPNEAGALSSLAEALLDTGLPIAALEYARRAVARIERLRGSLKSMVTRWETGESWERTYQIAIRCFLAAAEVAAADQAAMQREAFETACLYQGRLLHEELASGKRQPVGDPWTYLEPAEVAEFAEVEASLDAAQAAYDEQLRRTTQSLARRGATREEIERGARRELVGGPEVAVLMAATTRRRRLLERALLRASAGREPVQPRFSFDEIKTGLTTDKASMVDLLWSPGLRVGFVLDPGGDLRVLDFDAQADGAVDAIEAAVAALATALVSISRGRPVDPGAWREISTVLVRRLWEPLVAPLAGRPVRLVPAAALGAVPFAALQSSVSGGLLRILPGPALLNRPRPAAERKIKSLLAVGADSEGRLAGVVHDLELARSIDGATVRGLAEDPVGSLLRADAAYRLVVISSHLLHDRAPAGAAIRLAVRHGDGYVARDISSFELLHLRLRAGRVVLLGCTGALPSGGPELLSVANAILCGTGAEAVLATPYPVSDLGASLLWAELLPRLLDGAPSEVALAASIERLRSIDAGARRAYLADLRARGRESASLAAWAEPQLEAIATNRTELAPAPLLPVTDLDGWAVLG